MRTILIIILAFHGLVHLIGFWKAYNPSMLGFSQRLSTTEGILWLICTVLFLLTAAGLLFAKEYWWITAFIGILLSECLIIAAWKDAKYGTVINSVLLLITISGYVSWHYKNVYQKEVANNLRQGKINNSLLTEKDIAHLPVTVQKYIRQTGCMGKPKVNNFKIEFRGRIRGDGNSAWMLFTSEQYNFIQPSTRLFFMNATMNHLPVAGFHCFKNGNAFMDIRLLSLFKVQYKDGKEMDTAETVTFFNDMCCMAPATLIDKRITWDSIDATTTGAIFTNKGITIHARLHFNEKGELVNFVSHDRYAATQTGMKKFRWSTPLKNYRSFNGINLASYADANYQYPETEFNYGQFNLKTINYNVIK